MYLDFKEILSTFSFLKEGEDKIDYYFCSCGCNFQKKQENYADIDEEYLKDVKSLKDSEYSDDFSSMLTDVKLSIGDSIICPNCKKNMSTIENMKNVYKINQNFISGFSYKDDENDLILYMSTGKVLLNESKLELIEKVKHIRYNKKEKKIYYKDINLKEIEITLSQTIKTVNSFFENETNILIDIFNLHVYIGILSKHVIDIKNINIVRELLDEIKNKFNDAGIDNIKKIIVIFLGIIQYSNLSTISLTKGSKFLYDLMKKCDIPDVEELIENNVTSPIKIFNFLIKNYIKKINESINEDNVEAHEFLYKSKLLIKKEKENYKDGKVKNVDGKYMVISTIEDGNISKFIFNKIRNFNDYEQLIKYTKFLNKQELINIIIENDINTLVNIIDLIYFRDGMDYKEICRLLKLIVSYIKVKMQEDFLVDIEPDQIDFSYIKGFDFSFYDDSIMMLQALKFDRTREFDKIKDYNKLIKYHDQLVQYYKAVSDEEKNGKFKSFVSRFLYLEDKNEYNGPLDVKIIATPKGIIAEGTSMKHSGGSYSPRISNEQYIMAQVFDRSKNIDKNEPIRFTLGLYYNKTTGLEFDQVKGVGNKQGSDRFKKLMMDWLISKDISFKPIRDLKVKTE